MYTQYNSNDIHVQSDDVSQARRRKYKGAGTKRSEGQRAGKILSVPLLELQNPQFEGTYATMKTT